MPSTLFHVFAWLLQCLVAALSLRASLCCCEEGPGRRSADPWGEEIRNIAHTGDCVLLSLERLRASGWNTRIVTPSRKLQIAAKHYRLKAVACYAPPGSVACLAQTSDRGSCKNTLL